jgi:hypothetical protein
VLPKTFRTSAYFSGQRYHERIYWGTLQVEASGLGYEADATRPSGPLMTALSGLPTELHCIIHANRDVIVMDRGRVRLRSWLVLEDKTTSHRRRCLVEMQWPKSRKMMDAIVRSGHRVVRVRTTRDHWRSVLTGDSAPMP